MKLNVDIFHHRVHHRVNIQLYKYDNNTKIKICIVYLKQVRKSCNLLKIGIDEWSLAISKKGYYQDIIEKTLKKNHFSIIKTASGDPSFFSKSLFWRAVSSLTGLFCTAGSSLLESWKLALENWKLTFESWKLPLESWKLALESWKLALERWTLALESWKLALESWKLALECWKLALES